MRIAAASLLMVLVTVPVSADQGVPNPPSTAQFGAQRPPQSNPYGRLFEARDLLKQAQQQAAQNAPKRKTVCGMTMIEADPGFDPKMKITPRKDPNVRHTIRAIDPPICK